MNVLNVTELCLQVVKAVNFVMCRLTHYFFFFLKRKEIHLAEKVKRK